MEFKSEKELKEFVLDKGCFDEAENLRISEKFFTKKISHVKQLHNFLDSERQKVLDVGCGYGRVFGGFKPKARRYSADRFQSRLLQNN